ncbi:hypothetical protein F4819DRAFT_449702 [Hypoxylon fuscum]|nr:hypothetical protein F4819DRAFT_449702 [Hypoxylon fuscum]
MSTNQQRSTSTSPSRVHALSQHFETLASAEAHASGSESETDDKMNVEDKHQLSSKSEGEDKVSVDATHENAVYTGEYRIPLRERLRAARQSIKERAQFRRETGLLSVDAIVEQISPPRTPSTSRPVSIAECPDAPSKGKKYSDVKRLSSGSLKGCFSNEHNDDHLYDRQAYKLDKVAGKKLFIDVSNERQRKRTTTPIAGSPLRRSFFEEEMEAMSTYLARALSEVEDESAGRSETEEEETAVSEGSEGRI